MTTVLEEAEKLRASNKRRYRLVEEAREQVGTYHNASGATDAAELYLLLPAEHGPSL